MRAKSWLRGGLILLALLETVVGAWQYFFSQSFYSDFPTVSLDPPFNHHLMSDVGGLTLALTAVVAYAAISMEYRLICAALTGYIIFAVSHFLFHVTHLEGFTTADAVDVVTTLGIDAVVPIVLLILARRVERRSGGTTLRHEPAEEGERV